jgi:hypothetical protein
VPPVYVSQAGSLSRSNRGPGGLQDVLGREPAFSSTWTGASFFAPGRLLTFLKFLPLPRESWRGKGAEWVRRMP